MSGKTALLSVFHPPLADLLSRAPVHLKDDIIGEAWIALAEAGPDATYKDIYRKALNRAIRAARCAGSVSLDAADAADAVLAEAEAGAEAWADIATAPTRYRHYVERVRKPGETRRAAEIRLKRLLERYSRGDLFGLPGEEVAV